MTSRRNDLPNLSKYVAHTAQKSPEGQAAQTAGCMLSTIGAAVAWFALSRIIGILFGGLISVFVVLPVLAALVGAWIKHLTRPQTEADERRIEAHEAILYMNSAAAAGRLHRKLDPAAGMLLEECARHWARVHEALSGTFWEDKELPVHWKNVREQSLTAANRAMDDIIVMLKPILANRNPETSGQEFIHSIMESFFNVRTEIPIEPLPAHFLPARDIAQKLMLLADEVETTAQRAARDASYKDHYSSGSQIDVVLSELRAIREAETELEQDVRGG